MPAMCVRIVRCVSLGPLLCTMHPLCIAYAVSTIRATILTRACVCVRACACVRMRVCTCEQASRVGVDLSFEQRRERCMTARLALQGLAPKLGHAARNYAGSSLAYKAQDLAQELATL
eukprot:360685-Chlamydomonas_euryale.AAC.11